MRWLTSVTVVAVNVLIIHYYYAIFYYFNLKDAYLLACRNTLIITFKSFENIVGIHRKYDWPTVMARFFHRNLLFPFSFPLSPLPSDSRTAFISFFLLKIIGRLIKMRHESLRSGDNE